MAIKVSKSVKPAISTEPDKVIISETGKSGTRSTKLENELKQILDSTNDAVRVINKDFTIGYINRAFAEMTGADQKAVIGKKCWEVFSSPLCRTPDCRLQRILNGEKTVQVEIERTKKDGTSIPCLATTSPLTDECGNLVGIIEEFRDITERRHMEEHIRETDERYRALIELSNKAGEAIVMLQDINGKEGIQTFVSDQWLCITGYTRKELLGMSFFDLLSPSDQEASIARHRLKMSGQVVPGLYELDIVHKDGTTVPVELTGGYSNYQGQRTNVVYLRDISERKRTEETIQKERNKYLQLLEYAPVAMWEEDYSAGMPFINKLRSSGIADFNGYFNEHTDEFAYFLSFGKTKNSNQAALKLYETELDTIQSVIRKGHNNPFDPKNDEKNALFLKNIIKPISHMIEGRPGISVQEYPLPNTAGPYKYVRASFCVMPGHEHDLSLVYGAAIDITDRVVAEKELRKYKNHLEEIIKQRNAQLIVAEAQARRGFENEKILRQSLQEQIEERTQFTRALVHELKTPLTPLLSASEYLVNCLKDEVPREFAQNIYDGGKRLEKRVDEMMDLARGELGLIQLNRKEESLEQIIKDMVRYYTPQTSKKKQSISIISTDKIPSIKIDKDRIQQVIINLLDNASRITKKGGEIIVSTKVVGDSAIVEVIDKGRGIDLELQEDLFKPYKRMGKKEQLGGLGLGLALCKTFIELHGGKIWVKSKQGEGTTVSFSIPLGTNPELP